MALGAAAPMAVGAPEGALDTVAESFRGVTATGHASDPAVTGPVQVQVLVNGVARATVTANQPRTGGAQDGFSASILGLTQPALVCARALAAAPQSPVVLGCRLVPHAIPVASTVPKGQSQGPLSAEIAWVTANGQVAKVVDVAPVQNGAVAYASEPPRHPQLLWRIRLSEAGVPGTVFQSRPLRRLPGPPGGIVPTGAVLLFKTSVGFGLSNPIDGASGVVAARLRNLPRPLEVTDVRLGGDPQGRYVVTVRVRVRGFPALRFTYRRPLPLAARNEPGPPRVVLVEPAGPPTVPAPARRYAGVLDRAIVSAVEQQLDVAAANLAGFELTRAGAERFAPTSIRVSAIQVLPTASATEVHATWTIHAAAITGEAPTTVRS